VGNKAPAEAAGAESWQRPRQIFKGAKTGQSAEAVGIAKAGVKKPGMVGENEKGAQNTHLQSPVETSRQCGQSLFKGRQINDFASLLK